jgi:hypothetical protein
MEIAYHGLLLHLPGDDAAELMAVFTHGQLEALDPIVYEVSDAYPAWCEECSGRATVGEHHSRAGVGDCRSLAARR